MNVQRRGAANVTRRIVNSSLAVAGMLGASACALAIGAGGASASGASAVAARTISLNESGSLHLTSHHGFHLNEQGTASGTIRGTIYIHLDVDLDQPGDGRSQHLSRKRLAHRLRHRRATAPTAARRRSPARCRSPAGRAATLTPTRRASASAGRSSAPTTPRPCASAVRCPSSRRGRDGTHAHATQSRRRPPRSSGNAAGVRVAERGNSRCSGSGGTGVRAGLAARVVHARQARRIHDDLLRLSYRNH